METVTITQPQKRKTNGFHRQSFAADELWRISVEQYHAMICAKVLTEDDPVELLEGWLVQKMPKNPRHRATVLVLSRLLQQRIPDQWYIDPQGAITLSDSEPEPDVAIIRGDTLNYLKRHPGPKDVAIVIEVSDSTLQRDRTHKHQIYAHAGIPIYWIVNLVDNQVEVYSNPQPRAREPGYRERRNYDLRSTVPIVIEGQTVSEVNVRDIIPNTIEE